jgi:tRNA pseudouridine-54 N-methylase
MDTPITSEPLEPTQPDNVLTEQQATIKLVHSMAEAIKHLNPNIASSLADFKKTFEKDLEEMGLTKSEPVLPVEHAKVESLNESPNKPLT